MQVVATAHLMPHILLHLSHWSILRDDPEKNSCQYNATTPTVVRVLMLDGWDISTGFIRPSMYAKTLQDFKNIKMLKT